MGEAMRVLYGNGVSIPDVHAEASVYAGTLETEEDCEAD